MEVWTKPGTQNFAVAVCYTLVAVCLVPSEFSRRQVAPFARVEPPPGLSVLSTTLSRASAARALTLWAFRLQRRYCALQTHVIRMRVRGPWPSTCRWDFGQCTSRVLAVESTNSGHHSLQGSIVDY